MSTPAKSFDDLRSILGKLDRKIDSARSKRLGLDEPDEAEVADKAEQEGEQPGADQPGPDPATNGRSPFGRAKPLNRNGSPSAGTWIGGAGIG
jgi:hypothetical protein